MSTYEALKACLAAVEAADEVLEAIAAGTRRWGPEEMAVAKEARRDARLKALVAMEQEERLRLGSDDPMKIVRWLRTGEVGHVETVQDLYEDVGRLLDAANAFEILGEVAFECEDGKIYVITVEGCLGEASPEYLATLESEEE